MSNSNRYGSSRGSGIFRYLYYFIFALLSIWLAASIIFKKSPVNLIKDYSTKIGETVSESIPGSGSNEIVQKDSLISKLKADLAICQGKTDYHKAKVVISSSYLNMRSNPTLSSSVILQIPAESVVDIMFYDKQTFYLDGKPGSWAKIRYAGKEGFVWGNYLVKIDAASAGETLEEDIMMDLEKEIKEEQ